MWNRWRHHSAATTRHAIVGTSQTHGHTTLAPLLLSSSSADSVTNVASTCSSCPVFTATPLSTTRVLLDKKKHTSKHHRSVHAREHDVSRLSQPLEHVQQTLTSSMASTAAAHTPKDTRPTDERTAALLRSISRRGVSARRGEGSPLHPLEKQPQPLAGRDVMASFFSSATTPTARGCAGDGTTRRTESPLAKLFAAPPPQQQQQAPVKEPTSSKSQETNNIRERNASTGRSRTESPSSFTASSASSSSFSVQPTARPPPPQPPSRALLERLLLTIRREKRVPWADVARLHPEVARMPLYACRDEWCALLGTHGSAAPLSVNNDASSPSLEYSPPLFLCAAATGTGKSVLLPLFALDAHWAVLEARLEHSLRLYDTLTADNSMGTSTSPDVSVQMQGSAGVEEEAGEKQLSPQCAPFPLTSQTDFIRAFTACSRLCIVVSQPTRVACAELAKYTSALLSTVQLQRRSVPPTATSFSSAAVDPTATPSSAGGDESQKDADAAAAADVTRSLVGKRVGYAVGGEPMFCAETELIYATPGYVLNALQHTPSTAGMPASPSPPQRRLAPTTMMVDEAHCRDIETDALLAWMKLSRSGAARGSEASLMNSSARADEKSSSSSNSNSSSSRGVLRQYYVMSATMNLVAVDSYLSRPLELEPKYHEDHKRPQNKEEGHLSSGAACESPLLLLSPSQQNAVQRWWRGSDVSENANTRPSTSVQHTGTRHGDWRSAMVRDVGLRRAVLQVVEATDGEMGTMRSDAGEGLVSGSTTYSPTLPAASSSPSGAAASAAVSSLAGVQHTADAFAGAPLPANIVVSSEPFIVERFFMDDIDPDGGCFAQSRVLFSDAVRQAAAAAAAAVAATTQHGSPDADAAAAGQSSVTTDASRAVGHDRRRLSPPIDPRAFSHLPQCLTREGAAVRRVLAQAFDTRMSSYGSFAANSAQLAVFLVQLLQAARLRWSPSSSPSSLSDGEHGELRGPPYSSVTTATAAAAAPITLLLFVPGIAEMYQTVHSLERLCERVQQQQSPASQDYTSSSSSSVSPSVTVDVLRFGSELFSIGLLHSSAVGNPQDQLVATERTGAPLRLLIATNVAESSLTIPNTRIVVDTCLERRVRVDSVTGTTRVTTAFVSPSGLRQRCGRVGRTADGVVLHLSPRHFALPPADRQRHSGHPIPYKRSVVDTTPPAPLEPLAEGVVTVLLHLKFLFPRVTAALAALPSPPPAAELRVALQQLVDLDLLALPPPSPPRAASTHDAEKDTTTRSQVAAERREKSEHAKREAALSSRGGHAASTLNRLLNESTFTPKGLLVASLPLPYEHACLVYHGLQFLCVEETILMACAMAVPSLFIAPRVSAQSTVRVSERNYTASAFTWTHAAASARPALSPLEAFYRRLWLQRELAGFPPPRRATRSTTAQHTAVTSRGRDKPVRKVEEGNSSDGGGDDADAATRAGHLSEPLLLLAVLRQWYATASISGLVQLMAHYALNRSQMRQVDSMVEQCCQRLSALLQRDAHASARSAQPASRTSSVAAVGRGNEARGVFSVKSGDGGEEQDVSVYVSAALRDQLSKRETDPQAATPAPSPLLPFMQEWPEGMRGQLLRSLRRLQQAAHARAHLRGASQRSRSGLSQWFDSEERVLRLCSQPYVRTHPHPSFSPPSQWRGRARQFTPATPHDDAVQQEGEEEEEEDGEDRQRRQRREAAVRAHPSFAHDKDRAAAAPSADSALPYPSLAAGSASLLTAVPPPLATRLVRSRSPVYRAPRPPPPPPPVAFVLGRSEDRLCAAFIAAFGHRTMRGEDGGHRFHHRRLVRNLQALQHDADHVCTFSVDVQSRGTSLVTTGRSAEAVARALVAPEEARDSGGAAASTPYETLEAAGVTADAVRQALEPYLAGSGLLQLELFKGNRLAVAARFATGGFESLLDRADDGAKDVSPFTSPLSSLAAVEAQGMANSVLDTPVSSDETRSGAVAAVASGSPKKDVAENEEKRKEEEGQSSERDAATAEAALLRPVPLSRIGLATFDEASTAHGAARTAPVGGLSSAASIASRGTPAEHGESSSTRRSADVGNPYVQLAPFGVSLLIAAASSSLGGSGGGGGLGGLHRIPLPLPSANLASSRTQERQQQQQQQEEGTGSSEAAPVTSVPSNGITMAPAPSASSAHASTMNARAAPLFTTGASPAGMERFTVTWTDATSGVGKSLSRADVRSLGLGHLFPSPPPPAAAAAVAAPSTQPSHAPTGASWSFSSPQPTLTATAVATDARRRLSELTDTAASAAGVAAASLPTSSASLTLSVLPPVYVTRSITWKVPLPSLFSLATTTSTGSNKSSDDLQRLSPSPSSPLLPSSLRYCVLCQQLCASRLSFEQHCRSTAHLNHLHRAVSAGLSRRQLDVLYGYASTTVDEQRVASQGFSQRGRETKEIEKPTRSSPRSVAAAAAPLLSLLAMDTAVGTNNSETVTGEVEENSIRGGRAGGQEGHSEWRARSDAPDAVPLRFMTRQLHPCVIHPLSFLNCLQWRPRGRVAPPAAAAAAAPQFSPAGGVTAAVRGLAGAELADRATPLAVAGGLVSMQGSSDVLPPPHLRPRTRASAATIASDAEGGDSSSGSSIDGAVERTVPSPMPAVAAATLSANHVWVLNLSASLTPPPPPSASPSSSTSRHAPPVRHASPPPLSLLFVLAGYLAAASPQSMVAFLVNATHSHLHGVMLYSLGTWKLPQPLPVAEYMGVLEHVAGGGGWPGLLIPVKGHNESNAQRRECRDAVYDGLHWCVPSSRCRCHSPTPMGHASHNVTKAAEVTANETEGEAAGFLVSLWPTVEAALLLALHEYAQAQRNMVTLADYVERVLMKLQLSPYLQPPGASGDEGKGGRAGRASAGVALAHFIEHARGGQAIHVLLRDVGCVFLTPPHALTALLYAEESSANTESVRGVNEPPSNTLHPRRDHERIADSAGSTWSRRLSARALSVEGAAVEVMFTVPAALPSVLPPTDFAQQLRQFYAERHRQRWGLREEGGGAGGGVKAQGVTVRKATAPRSRRDINSRERWDDPLRF